MVIDVVPAFKCLAPADRQDRSFNLGSGPCIGNDCITVAYDNLCPCQLLYERA